MARMPGEGAVRRGGGARGAPLPAGRADSARFEEGPSVAFWETFEPAREAGRELSRLLAARSPLEVAELSAGAAQEAGASTLPGALFWGHSLQRAIVGGLAAAAGAASPLTPPASTNARERLEPERVAGLVAESAAAFRQDREHVRNGVYLEPYDQAGLGAAGRWAARSAGRFILDAAAALDWGDALPPVPSVRGGVTGSEAGATELFGGMEDIVQRQSLVPLADFMADEVNLRGTVRGMRLLDLGCGSGRGACLAKDNWPELEVTCADLSSESLDRARCSAAEWQRLRAPRSVPRAEGVGAHFNFARCDACALPFPDASFDAVVCTRLLSELPPQARSEAVHEVFRVLRPGGLAVITDAAQPGDRPAADAASNASVSSAPAPADRDGYARENLGALFAAVGFACERKELCAAAKTLSFRRPRRAKPAVAPPPPAAPDGPSSSR